jgi:RNA polymerase sigma-70 factor (ECF subfamily)
MKPDAQRTPFTDPGDEAARVLEAQRGSQAAFAEIVRGYQRAVYRVAYGVLRNATDADDITQETFLKAWRALARFRVGEPLYPWLARIAVNSAFTMLRVRRRRPEAPLEPMLEAGRQWAAGEDPADVAATSERDRRLEQAFAVLSEEHRAVLVLRVVEDMPYEEIARALNVPVGTVMSRLSRARAELRARFRALTGGTS